MSKKIEKFPEGFDIPALREKWLAVGRSTDRADRLACEQAVREIYAFCGYQEPTQFYWGHSPLTIALTKRMFEEMAKEGEIGDNLEANLRANLGDNLEANLEDNLWANLRANLGANLEANLRDNLWANLGANLEANLRDNLWANLRDNLWANLGDNLGDSTIWQIMGGMTWYTAGAMGTTAWLAFYDAGRQIGVQYPEKVDKALDAMITLTGTGFWFPHEGTVFMCDNPIELNLDAQGRLHNDHGPSMLFADGYALWNFHGTRVPAGIIEDPKSINVESIMKEANSEVRRCMCEMMGWDKFVKDAKLKLVDECDDPANAPHKLRLYDVPDQVFSVPVRLLLMVNATPKRDGVVPLYGETVPKECCTALEAASWQVDVPVEMYARMARAS